MGEAHCRLHNCTSLDIFTIRLICAAVCLGSWSFRSLLYHISLLLGWDARMIYKEIQMTIEISSKISANIPIYNMMMTMGENPQWLWIMMVVRWRRWKKRWCTEQDQRNDDGETLKEKVAETARKKFLWNFPCLWIVDSSPNGFQLFVILSADLNLVIFIMILI